MKFPNLKLIAFIVLVGSCILFVFYVTRVNDISKDAYIVSNELFQSFDGTKSLKNKIETKEGYYKSVLDSLKLEISLCQSSADLKNNLKKQGLEQSYRSYYDQLMQYNNEYIIDEEGKIWLQLNQYISEYGKSHSYKFILGANGNGSLMYADSTLNITQDIIEYSNMKYRGK